MMWINWTRSCLINFQDKRLSITVLTMLLARRKLTVALNFLWNIPTPSMHLDCLWPNYDWRLDVQSWFFEIWIQHMVSAMALEEFSQECLHGFLRSNSLAEIIAMQQHSSHASPLLLQQNRLYSRWSTDSSLAFSMTINKAQGQSGPAYRHLCTWTALSSTFSMHFEPANQGKEYCIPWSVT